MNRLLITIGLLVIIALAVEYYDTSEISREEWEQVDQLVLENPKIVNYLNDIYWPKSYLSHRDLRNLKEYSR